MSTFAGPERRRKTRFPIELGTRYAVHAEQEIQGEGLTVNISSRGVLIRAAHNLPPKMPISVMMEWPVPNDDAGRLSLHIYGTVMRSENGLVAVRFSIYELRTRTKRPERQRQPVSNPRSARFR